MKYFELTTFTVRVATHGKAMEQIEATLQDASVGGQLFGCWYSELGTLNQVAVLRGFDSLESRQTERERLLLAGNPLGVEEFMTDMNIEDYTLFPFLEGITPGDFGPFYELRVYDVRPSGLQVTLDGWKDAVPPRTTDAYSPLSAAFYATNGTTPRIMHLWPYRSLEERLEVRTRTVKEGVWPPKGGPAQLLDMQSTIFLPAAFSPLH
ncbi:NIPSNAP family protein [Vreelandella olivaria]|uniref:NIPSNAP family protein n=1 Tax=Vreelandella olivaria TaxID=390919 RepID=UPI00201F87AA|nr:NIPSNAP family protein [Halomonas olivaria]